MRISPALPQQQQQKGGGLLAGKQDPAAGGPTISVVAASTRAAPSPPASASLRAPAGPRQGGWEAEGLESLQAGFGSPVQRAGRQDAAAVSSSSDWPVTFEPLASRAPPFPAAAAAAVPAAAAAVPGSAAAAGPASPPGGPLGQGRHRWSSGPLETGLVLSSHRRSAHSSNSATPRLLHVKPDAFGDVLVAAVSQAPPPAAAPRMRTTTGGSSGSGGGEARQQLPAVASEESWASFAGAPAPGAIPSRGASSAGPSRASSSAAAAAAAALAALPLSELAVGGRRTVSWGEWAVDPVPPPASPGGAAAPAQPTHARSRSLLDM